MTPELYFWAQLAIGTILLVLWSIYAWRNHRIKPEERVKLLVYLLYIAPLWIELVTDNLVISFTIPLLIGVVALIVQIQKYGFRYQSSDY